MTSGIPSTQWSRRSESSFRWTSPSRRSNVIFDRKDYEKLDHLGLTKKKILTEYFAIERRLGFLNAADKNRVMDVIKEELGYKEVRMPQKYYSLSDLLRQEDIRILEELPTGEKRIEICVPGR